MNNFLNRNLKLIVSIAASLYLYSLIFTFNLGLILIFSIMVHEYGHYYWMGQEGIAKKDMVMIPLVGALARSYEPWPNRGAEGKIGLAGPILGIIPNVIFCGLFFLTDNPMWAASVVLSAYINLFNLIPVFPLDGGRIFNALLVSLSKKLQWFTFVWTGLFVLTLALVLHYWLIAIIIGYIAFMEINSIINHSKFLKGFPIIFTELVSITFWLRSDTPQEIRNMLEVEIENLKNRNELAKKIVDAPPMNKKELFVVSISYILVVMGHLASFVWMSKYINLDFLTSFSITPIIDYF